MSPSFEDLALSSPLCAVLAELGYDAPTTVQAAAIPPMLAGRDIVAQSATGSGKTAAFGLAMLERLSLDEPGVQGLVLGPTRELATQVARELRTLGRKLPGLRVVELTGGAPIRPQSDALARGAHIVVGTPGRTLDHLRRGTLEADSVRLAVLDEADRMLDMGFGDEVESALGALSDERQLALFSATFPPSIDALAARHLRAPERVTVAEEQASRLRAYWLETPVDTRPDALYWALAHFPNEAALVFCNFKATVRELTADLYDAGVSVDALHGDLAQAEREEVLARFRNGSLRVLVASDVAARGIDIDALELVVNYELPPRADVFVHRVGRTARAGSAGVALSLATPARARDREDFGARLGAPIELVEMPAQDDLPTWLAQAARPAAMATLRIGGGRKDKLRPGDILGALTGDAAGLDGAQIGAIEIHPTRSYVAVARDVARRAARGLERGRIKRRRFRVRYLG